MIYLSHFGQFVHKQAITIDEAENSQINNIANACLKPLQWVFSNHSPDSIRRFTFQEGRVKPLASSITPNKLQLGLGYLICIPATVTALFLKTLNHGFNPELRERFRKIDSYRQQEHTFKQLINREAKLPALPDPFTLSNERFAQIPWKRVDSFWEEAHLFRGQATIELPEFESFFSRLNQFRQAKPHWQMVEQFFSFERRADAIYQELTSSFHNSTDEWHKKVDELKKELRSFEQSSRETNFGFYTTKVAPLSCFVSDLKWVISCLELKKLSVIAANGHEEETLAFRSSITFPYNCTISESLYNRALNVVSTAAEVQRIGEKYSKLIEKHTTVKAGVESVSDNPKIQRFTQSLDWIDRGLATCKTKIALVRESKILLENPHKAAELIKLVYQLKQQSSLLDFSQLASYAHNAHSTYAARNLLPFCQNALDKISQLRASIFNPLEQRAANRPDKDPLNLLLADQRKKLDMYESQTAILKMWAEIVTRRELLSDRRLDGERCLSELKEFTDNLKTYREKIIVVKEKLTTWGRILNFFTGRSNQELIPDPVFFHLCLTMESDLSELESMANQLAQVKARENKTSSYGLKAHWQILGLSQMPKAKDEMMAAYKLMARKYHPNSQTGKSNPEMWNKINEAKEALLKEFDRQ